MSKDKRDILITSLKREGQIKTKIVEKAFLNVQREKFVPELLKKHAYVDTPLEIGNGQTISAPHMVAIMCETLDIKKGQTILEIGTGSGYHAAIVSKIVGEKGHVYTIERFSSLAKKAKKNLENANIKNVTVEVSDGSNGLPQYAPYERIYVTCASPKIPIPQKKEGRTTSKDICGCAFVPLIGKHGF